MTIKLLEVENQRQLSEFLRFPRDLYRGDPLYIPPHEGSLRKLLTVGKSPFLGDMDHRLFLARRGPEVVGRIGAFRDRRPRATPAWDADFGFFECRRDPEAARYLLDAVAVTLRSWGARSMAGPINLSINLECGLLVEGDGEAPRVMMTHNPSWYQDLLEGSGLRVETDLLSYRLELPTASRRLHRIADRWRRRTELRIEPMNMRRYKDEMTAIGRVFNQGWSENLGASELSKAGIRHLVQEFRSIIDPSLVFLARDRGEVVGFSLALPDVNPLLRYIADMPAWWQLPAALWYQYRHRPKAARLLALGLLPQYRGNGLTAALMTSTVEAAGSGGYEELELSWILEENRDARKHAEALGAAKSRRYRLYRRDLP